MKRIAAAAAAATLVVGLTLSPATAQAQERERFTNALRPLSAPSIGAGADVRSERGVPWRGSRNSNREIARSQPERIYDRERDRVYEDDRRDDGDWGETAMIVGGTAAAGAGVGGLIGGTKGALIGAAIAGGGAAIYEGTRRR
jgi:hypothetical protein